MQHGSPKGFTSPRQGKLSHLRHWKLSFTCRLLPTWAVLALGSIWVAFAYASCSIARAWDPPAVWLVRLLLASFSLLCAVTELVTYNLPCTFSVPALPPASNPHQTAVWERTCLPFCSTEEKLNDSCSLAHPSNPPLCFLNWGKNLLFIKKNKGW